MAAAIETQPTTSRAWDLSYLPNVDQTEIDKDCICSDSDLILDKALMPNLKHLLWLYKTKMSAEGEGSSNIVSSGGLQQFINRRSLSEREKYKQETSSVTSFFNLPENVQLHIFSFLGIKDLCRITGVCVYWRCIAEDNLLWRRRLERDVQTWDTISYTTNPDMYQECQSDWSYKDIYLRCSPEVNSLVKQTNFSFHSFSSMLRSFLPKKVPRLAMFGPGLESSTSRLTRNVLESGTFAITGMFPGQFEGVGSGFTLKMPTGNLLNLVTLYTSTRVERQALAPEHRLLHNRLLHQEGETVGHIRQPIRDLCHTLDAFVFVVDASQGAETVRQSVSELSAMISEASIPLLVLSCVPDASVIPKVSCMEVVSILGLGQLSQPWQVHSCVGDPTLKGVQDGLEWVVHITQR